MTKRVNGLARGAAAGLAAVAALSLAACSSPPSRFYTLSPGAARGASADTASANTVSANPPFLIEVPAVDVPEQIAKNPLVVQKSATQVDVLEQERWASPVADEIRRALSGDLAARLGTIDVAGAAYPAGVPVYRVSFTVQRFESWPGKRAAIDAVWSVRAVGTQAVMTCRTSVAEPVGDGYDALVAGHRHALDAIANAAATGVRALAAQRAGTASAGKNAVAPVVRCPANANAG
jgi:uncharacterized lipoprotein YmbA